MNRIQPLAYRFLARVWSRPWTCREPRRGYAAGLVGRPTESAGTLLDLRMSQAGWTSRASRRQGVDERAVLTSRWRQERLGSWSLVLAALLLIASGCRVQESAPRLEEQEGKSGEEGRAQRVSFLDETERSGLTFLYQNGSESDQFSIVESLGGGVGFVDFDSDGQWDLFFPGGGMVRAEQPLTGVPSGLFWQREPWRFEEVAGVSHATAARTYTHGVARGDYDNDGFADLLVTGYDRLQLLHNQGDGTWLDVTHEAGLHDTRWSSSAGWGDINGDGALDLYVAHYVDWSWQNHPDCRASVNQRDICPPRSFRGLNDTFYLAQGDGTFADHSTDAGLVREGKGLGVLIADLDHDADVDIYVANDTVDNFFYLNDGQGHLQEVGTVSGLATDDRGAANGSMGIAQLDYNRDGLTDVWVTNYERESFAVYRNDGHASFTHASEAAGIFGLGASNVGFGTVAGDFDRDGDEDLVVTNGHVIRFPERGYVQQKPLLLELEQDRFQALGFSQDAYFAQAHHGRGLAVGDLDSDGSLDLVFANSQEAAAVLRNTSQPDGSWVGVRLIGRASNRDAVGSRVVLHTNGRPQLRLTVGGSSYLSQHDPRLHWGIPRGERATHLEIVWPDGQRQEVTVDQERAYLTVRQP
jgi:hypothetical protein